MCYNSGVLFRIDPSSQQPLHEQVAACVRRALSDGTLSPGERLPSARDLAASLQMNMHTVLRAYASLREEGLVEMRRGRGAVVTGSPGSAEVEGLVRALLAAGKRHGLTAAELAARIQEGPQR